MSTKCDETAELIPAYALEALSEAEQALVDAHVAECPGCSALQAQHRAVAENLLYTPPPVAVPTHLEADLRRRLQEERAKQDVGQTSSPGQVWRARLFTAAARPVLAMSVVLILLLVGSHLYWARTNMQWKTQQDSLVRDLEIQGIALYLLAAGGHSVELQGNETVPKAEGWIILASDRKEAVVMMEHMPTLRTGTIYQLWLIDEGQRDSGGLFTVDASGRGVGIVQLPRLLVNYRAAEVTVEPTRGSTSPTNPWVIGCGPCLEPN